ncbi:MAG: hypothetical protein ACYC7D_13315 [Nitrososphaerales archaeon]
MLTFETATEKVKESGPRRKKRTTVERKVDSHLMALVSADRRMYGAMENFLLADPERELPQLGEPADFAEKAGKYRE